MATFTKGKLSGSTNGKGIKVATNSTPGTTIHTAVSGTADFDEIFIYCVNSSGSDVKLTIEYGGTSGPDDHIEQTIPAESGLYLVVPGLLLNNSLVVKAFAATANVLVIHGYVHTITV